MGGEFGLFRRSQEALGSGMRAVDAQRSASGASWDARSPSLTQPCEPLHTEVQVVCHILILRVGAAVGPSSGAAYPF
jgi:hypothetical protein